MAKQIITYLQHIRTRFLGIAVGEEGLHHWTQIRALFRELHNITCQLEMNFSSLSRARFNSRPWKEAVRAHIKAFLHKGSLAEVDILAVNLEMGLMCKGYDEIEKKITVRLDELMLAASKDQHAFINVCECFFSKNLSVQ